MKILKNNGMKLEFLLEDTDPAFVNSLRRIMISEVPTLAVQWADIHENNSALFDEVLSHRLGMIPLRYDPKRFNLPDQCVCKGKGCPLCQVVFIMEKKGPAVAHSGDLKSSDKRVGPTDPNIPIVEVLEGQSVKLEAVAKLGVGTGHAKHHAANASYQYYPMIESKGASPADLKKAVKACPKDTLVLKGNKLSIKDPARCDLCRSCMEAAKGVKMHGDKNRIIFKVESVSGLDPDYIVTKAAELLLGKANEFKQKLDKV